MQVSVQPRHRTSIGNMEDMMLRVAGPSTTTSSAGNVYNSADLYIIYVKYEGTGAEIFWPHPSVTRGQSTRPPKISEIYCS